MPLRRAGKNAKETTDETWRVKESAAHAQKKKLLAAHIGSTITRQYWLP